MRRIIVILSLLGTVAAAGCTSPRQETGPAVRDVIDVPAPLNIPGSPKRLKPIRVNPYYPAAKLTAKLAIARNIFGSYGIPVTYTSVVEMDAPQWLEINQDDVAALDAFCKDTSEYVLFFTKDVSWGGLAAGGLGAGRWAAIAETSCANVVAHEAGHAAMAVAEIDTPTRGHRKRVNNVMCGEMQGCDQAAVVFDTDQVAAIKLWGTALQKRNVTGRETRRVVVCPP